HRHLGGLGATARAATIRAAVDGSARAEDFVSPGHVFPLRARPGGVLVRSGQTEGSVDLARLAGRDPSGVICEVMGADGTMMRLPKLLEFGERFDIPVATVADLIRYRLHHERLVTCCSEARLPTEFGEFTIRCYQDSVNGQVHVALVYGDPTASSPALVRVHRADTVADVFGLDFLPSRSRLAWSLQHMAKEGAGVLVYLRPDGDDDPLDDRLQVYGALARGERPPGGSGMGFHDFGIGAQILRDLGLSEIRVITSSPRAFKGISGYGITIVDWVPLGDAPPAAEPAKP
ncbi:MAG: 3,4-dihydroxy-2-butanone-4-phosphate synthase, partial [Myxococcales bacterium]|nr:3,4-dihydroxy-2-butanone-4-phosphate synthase [Myxococcales bacterium]